MAQLELFPDEPAVYDEIPVAQIDELVPDAAEFTIPPSKKMLASVERYGILEPILLIKRQRGNKFDIAAGRRRIAAAKATNRPIPARIFPWGWTVTGVLTLVENEVRSSNDLAEWNGVRECLEKGMTNDDIMKRAGLGRNRLKILLRLNRLQAPLKQAFIAGTIAPKVAARASKQKPKVQKQLVTILKRNGTLTNPDISGIRRAMQAQAVAALPEDLFNNTDDWRAFCLERLNQARNEMLGRAPSIIVEELDRLMANIQQTVIAVPVDAQPVGAT